jgi:predicted nucleic acid-binding Zn ribbon protein
LPERAGGGGGRGRGKGPGAGAQSVGDLLAGFLAETKVGREVARDALEEGWREVVGPEVAVGTRVRGLRDKVLTVEVSSSALLQELRTFYRASILAALKARGAPLKDLKDIAFKLGSW